MKIPNGPGPTYSQTKNFVTLTDQTNSLKLALG